jgi:O-antigen/teichoic acid export membrane protein
VRLLATAVLFVNKLTRRHWLVRLSNLGIRASTLVTKFLLVFVLAKLLQPAEFGLYGLIFASISFLVYLLGCDFYKYANRELIVASQPDRSGMLRDQAVFYGLSYLVGLPLGLLLFFYEILPWSIFLWFVLLLILEHLGREVSRILTCLSQQLPAALTLFLRAGAWVLVLMPMMWFMPALRQLEWVFAAWAAGLLISIVYGCLKIKPSIAWHRRAPINWQWLSTGFKKSLPFAVGTLALTGIPTFDRYLLEVFSSRETLAAYVLFAGIANVMRAFLDSSVFVFTYPALITAARDRQIAAFAHGMRVMTLEAVLVMLVVTGLAIMLAKPLLQWIGHATYLQHLNLLFWALGAISLYALGLIAHYGLYALRCDRTIVVSQLAGFAVFFATALALREWLGHIAIPLAVCIGYGVIVLWKWTVFMRSFRVFCAS